MLIRPGRLRAARAFLSTKVIPRLDYTFLRENTADVQLNADRRNVRNASAVRALETYEETNRIRREIDDLRRERNLLAKQRSDHARERGREIKDQIADLEIDFRTAEKERLREAAKIPNMSHPEAPVGDESRATVVRRFGPEPDGDTGSKLSHLDVCDALDLADFENATKVTGPKFVFLKNAAARMELALCSMAMDRAAEAGFVPCSCPDLVRATMIDGCGFAPRDDEPSQIYSIEGSNGDSDDASRLCLTGTAEIPMAGLMADRVLSADEIPTKLVGVSHCFRTEAGAGGKESKGLYRLHQFTKVELFAFATPEMSASVLDEICEFQTDMYADLGLSGRVLDMPTEELGASAHRKYDVEVWMPSRGGYGEVCSASNCTDYQSRRLNIRYEVPAEDGKGRRKRRRDFLHTLNGTAVAVPRVILAILETHQREDGTVDIPEVLQPYMNGLRRIEG